MYTNFLLTKRALNSFYFCFKIPQKLSFKKIFTKTLTYVINGSVLLLTVIFMVKSIFY